MDPDGLEGFDYTQPLHYALSQLNGAQYQMVPDVGVDQFDNNVYFPKPSSLSAMADEEDSEDKPPPSTMDIIDELVENVDNYPKIVTTMMQRGLLKKRQQCRKCDRLMHLRRRKTCYEWRCRTKDKKGDCSSCSIKFGSWFENTKLSFKTVFNFLIMHCKNCSTGHMANMLKLSTHSINEIRRIIYELTDRIVSKYPQIGPNRQNVFMEVIKLQPKKTSVNVYKVLAGQESGSRRCFAIVLPDSSSFTFERIKNEKVDSDAQITMVKTSVEDGSSIATVNAAFFDEERIYSNDKDRFFTNLRKDHPENVFTNIDTLQSWLNDQVVRRTEGKLMLEKCVEELKTYTV